MTKSTSLPVLLIATLFVSILGLAAPAGAAETIHTCFGEEATIVGTDGRDHIRGTRGRDVIVGLGGNDVIRGLGGDDLICGNEGHDRIWGQAGNDMINGGYGRDRIQAGAGDDLVKGMQARDRIWDGPGNDVVQAGGGNDILIEGTGWDDIRGGAGTDTIRFASGDRICSQQQICNDGKARVAEKLVDLNAAITVGDSVSLSDCDVTTCDVTYSAIGYRSDPVAQVTMVVHDGQGNEETRTYEVRFESLSAGESATKTISLQAPWGIITAQAQPK